MVINMIVSFFRRSVQGVRSFSTTNFNNTKSDPIVTISQGQLKGATGQLFDGSPYFSFKGIPYAEAPIGKQRFMAPLPPKPWQGTFEATSHGPVCTQYDMISRDIVEGSESCLFLNVYTKSLKPASKLPVMFFIHGGGFMSGSGDSTDGLGPEFIIPHDVILVTINYRLEVLGFLAVDTPEVPGNAGMKDQVAALKWVQKNIAQFGGDPNNVTIFGESAGAAAVIYLMQSPMAKGFFHKAIAQSGVSIHDWAQGKDGKSRAFRVGKVLGKDTNDTKELLEFLRSVPATSLAKLTFSTLSKDEKYRGLPLHFAPVIEKKFDNVEPLITETPMDSLLAKRMNEVPLILGYTSAEALLMLPERLNKLEFINKNLEYLVPREIAERVGEEKTKEFGARIKKFYVGNREFTANDAEAITNMLSDIHFVYNIHRFANFYSRTKQPTFLYKFGFETDLNVMKNASGLNESKGACHADDLFYLFCGALNKELYEEQKELRDYVYRVTKMWTDFAKTGNPTPESKMNVKWEPYTPATNSYLTIDKQMTFGPNAERDRVEFWNKLYSDAGLPCITKNNL